LVIGIFQAYKSPGLDMMSPSFLQQGCCYLASTRWPETT